MQKQKRTVKKKPSKTVSKNITKVSTAPMARSTTVINTFPKVKSSGSGVTISHREYLAEVHGTPAFSVAGYVMNPGLETLPWVAGIASRYEYYHIKKLCVSFVPRCPATTTGTIGLSFDKDVKDDDPADYRSFMNYMASHSASPWNSLSVVAPPTMLTPQRLYVRSEAIAGTDPRLYDWGKILVASQGDAVLFGDVYVDYVIEFSIPDLHVSPSGSPPSEPGLATLTSVVGPGESLAMANNGAEVQFLKPLADIATEAGLPITEDARLTKGIGALLGLYRKVKPIVAAANSFSTPQLGAVYTEVNALVLPIGNYHISHKVTLQLKQTNATARSFKWECNNGGLWCGLIHDGARDTSPYQNLTLTGIDNTTSFTAYSTTTSAGHVTLVSPTYALNAHMAVTLHLEYDLYVTEEDYETAPMLTLSATNTGNVPDNGAYWIIDGASEDYTNISVGQPLF